MIEEMDLMVNSEEIISGYEMFQGKPIMPVKNDTLEIHQRSRAHGLMLSNKVTYKLETKTPSESIIEI